MPAITAPRLPLALTSGEPAGIGPDLCLQLATTARAEAFVCLADRDLLEARARQLKLSVKLSDYRRGMPVTCAAGALSVLHVALPEPVRAGELRSGNARQVLQLLDRAVDGCRSAEFAAMVTAPVQKSIINEAGVPFSGHTEYLAARCGVDLPVMLLVAGTLRVALATIHLPLRDVSAALHKTDLVRILAILGESLQRFWGIAQPHLAVCGLNPHAGESGHLGDEEIRLITPAIEAARARGMNVSGPYPADTLFVPRHLAGVDAVLAMFHDQGLPVLKHAGFGEAVNVTLGLPIVRTSVDHGTALDLAGSGQADAGSLRAAIQLAAQMTAHSR
jgi:4-hydroxythreonine-4-phosphate dehydrogenase